ncbi:VTT domain-containing protein [Arthrobacter sp. zg-Y1143]|uniref:DedA family protein n=1 Tax=Arthrobacter sp. zg-Y1143 TaxID=3049065 RepID=UPI0032E432B3
MTLTAAAAVSGPVRPPTSALLPEWLDPQVFLANPALGPWVVLLVCGIVFAETGLLIGFFLPGDSLLFTAGLLVATGTIHINVWLLGLLVFVSAFVGDQTGYYIGKKTGPAIFKRENSRLFKQENVHRAEVFFERHGGKAVILARFVPVVRTFTPVVAGVAKMNYKTFVTFNVIGAFFWGVGVTLLGYVLGDRVPFVRENLDLIFVGVVVLSVIPIVIEVLRQSRKASTKHDDGGPAGDAEESGPASGQATAASAQTPAARPAAGDAALARQAEESAARPATGDAARARQAEESAARPARHAAADGGRFSAPKADAEGSGS